MSRSIKVAVVGLGFGKSFVPIFKDHPSVSEVAICETNPELLQEIGELEGIKRRFHSLEDLLEQGDIDAVHLCTPVPLHVVQTLAVLNAGKHCACAVPMACDIDGLRQIVQTAKQSGKNYVMMETGVYNREFFYVKALNEEGRLGNLTYLKGDYFQDLEAAYPDYWRHVPPMHYATHVVAPLLALANTRATGVSCLGGGKLRKDIADDPGNPFPLQVAHFKLENSDAVAQVNRAWYQTAHCSVEGFSVYGDKIGFEWEQLGDEDHVLFELEPIQGEIRWREAPGRRVAVPYRPDLVPEPLGQYALSGHGGSHPHLVHEFVSSIIEERQAWIDPLTAADWCAPGICAHQSSLQGGEWVEIPSFS